MIAGVLLAIGYFAQTPKSMPPVVSQIAAPANEKFLFAGVNFGPPVLSPNGKLLAFTAAGAEGRQLIWVRPLDSATARPLEGTEGASFAFWSPDSGSLGFFAHGKLNRIDASGGPSLALCDASGGRGGTWARDGTILFSPNITSPLMRIPASGGEPQPVTQLDLARGERSHRWPQFLPDNRHFLYLAQVNSAEEGIYAASLDGGKPKLIIRNNSNAIYASGYLLFVREGTLMAQQFDANQLTLTGEAWPLAEHTSTSLPINFGVFTVSENGILTYEIGGAEGGSFRLLWFDRDGKQIAETGTPDTYFDPRISPDGRKLAVAIPPSGGHAANIWVFDLARGGGLKTRLTFSDSPDREPAWTPDGKTIAFMSLRSGAQLLYQNASDGTGVTTRLLADDAGQGQPSFSADGRYLIFVRRAKQANSHLEIWALPLFGDRKAFPVVQAQVDVSAPALSPNGKWLAYVSDESGASEIYVVPFLHGSGKWEISTNGGLWPCWRNDGRELFYVSPDNKIMSAEISDVGSSFVIGKVQPLFQATNLFTLGAGIGGGWFYDVTRDGKRFVVVNIGAHKVDEPVTLVTNWPALLKKQ